MACFNYEMGRNTANMPVMGRKCYCGTTACIQQPQLKPRAYTQDNEEREFYRRVLHSRLLCEDKSCDICPSS